MREIEKKRSGEGSAKNVRKHSIQDGHRYGLGKVNIAARNVMGDALQAKTIQCMESQLGMGKTTQDGLVDLSINMDIG